LIENKPFIGICIDDDDGSVIISLTSIDSCLIVIFCFLFVRVTVCVLGSIWTRKPRVLRSLPGGGRIGGDISLVIVSGSNGSIEGNSSTTGVVETIVGEGIGGLGLKLHNKDFCLRCRF
jgi:hypothetical protein